MRKRRNGKGEEGKYNRGVVESRSSRLSRRGEESGEEKGVRSYQIGNSFVSEEEGEGAHRWNEGAHEKCGEHLR